MTILECKRFFKTELAELYTEAESARLYTIFVYEKTGLDRFQQRRFSDQQMLVSDVKDFKSTISLLKTGKPYQQILGHTEFYRMKFLVNEHVLIPRPETEELLEIAIDRIKETGNRQPRILDIGTGSGIIPIVLKKKFPKAEVTALDFSKEALELAQKNAEYHEVKIKWIQADYLHTELVVNYDVIISNPPYIGADESDEISDLVKKHEPHLALFSPTADALVFYRKIAEDCRKHLVESGQFFLEINQKLGAETLELFEAFSEKKLIKDLSDNHRFIIGIK